VHRHKHRRGGRRRLTARRWPGLAPFAAVYLLYDPYAAVASGNHCLFDVAAGLLVTVVGCWTGRLTGRPFQQRLGVPSVPRPIPATRS
jgi:hypothetical protein